ncbi:MAG: glycine cleavage system aminomethyltransferase GcvT [Aquisalimonadaceae bacterium]
MLQRTPLNEWHRSAGAKMVDFAGWEMPLHYGSQLEEHRQVRSASGLFDVSHMAVVDISGPDARDYLRRLFANDISRLTHSGMALYTCMLNDQGGIRDDLIVYYLSEARYRCVVNAATREADLNWMRTHADDLDLRIRERRDMAMLAVQGPQARVLLGSQVDAAVARQMDELTPFGAIEHGDWLIARTGYTGEDGFEIILPSRQSVDFWEHLVNVGVRPCGLGARDSLRLEAGLCLYGQDMDQTTSPLASGLGWSVAWEAGDRAFIGRAALEGERAAGPGQVLRGLVLDGRGVLRPGQEVRLSDGRMGGVTSGGFSPMLGKSIALARLPANPGDTGSVEVRGRVLPVRVVKPPFVRQGRVLV